MPYEGLRAGEKLVRTEVRAGSDRRRHAPQLPSACERRARLRQFTVAELSRPGTDFGADGNYWSLLKKVSQIGERISALQRPD